MLYYCACRQTGPSDLIGNKRYRTLVREALQDIDLSTWDAEKKNKTAQRVVDQVKARNGSFVKLVPKDLNMMTDRDDTAVLQNTTSTTRLVQVVDEKTAVAKTKQCFRHVLRVLQGDRRPSSNRKSLSKLQQGIGSIQAGARQPGNDTGVAGGAQVVPTSIISPPESPIRGYNLDESVLHRRDSLTLGQQLSPLATSSVANSARISNLLAELEMTARARVNLELVRRASGVDSIVPGPSMAMHLALGDVATVGGSNNRLLYALLSDESHGNRIAASLMNAAPPPAVSADALSLSSSTLLSSSPLLRLALLAQLRQHNNI